MVGYSTCCGTERAAVMEGGAVVDGGQNRQGGRTPWTSRAVTFFSIMNMTDARKIPFDLDFRRGGGQDTMVYEVI